MKLDQKEILSYVWIVIGSALYAVGTVLFIFPHGLLLGGTSGISVILNAYIPFSPGSILMMINFSLLILAFFVLGRDMAVKTLAGSVCTTVFVGLIENVFQLTAPLIQNIYLSAVIGALIIAAASGILFYVDSSSGGTDIMALIVKKYFKLHIGRAMFITDILIVVIGGVLSGLSLTIGSFIGFVIKTSGIDFVIGFISRFGQKKPNS